ncbi:hypothetical protein TH53_06135 [Pedobacter lusitanus]|uniref:Contig25, whole genome shotgun sequence n=1 Tax=Pedobacter lusitanus TaxID=1503925 RepID=A0A0D0GP99_9SPHI|nr:DUF4286 family protein [Pedobacter lusitanus]KIO78005.1 hypothetical protein TH53_06135 [Pedobacter lusitanus]
MLLYNVTLIIEEVSAAAWLQWMQEEHIPEVMSTGLFVSNRLLRVVDSPNEGVTYCAQYVLQSIEDYNAYQLKHADSFSAELNSRFKDKYVSFATLMEYIA